MRIGASLVKNLSARTHLARFTSSRPELTTAKAKKLGIKELISEFTTYHPCCANRVLNIHRGADIMDGTIILSGGTFSLNEVLGQRTAERGFSQRAADLQWPSRGCDRRRGQPDLDDDLQRRLLRWDADHHAPAAPVLHLALSDGAGGDGLVGRSRADLEERLARGGSRRHGLHGYLDHRPPLLVEVGASRGDRDGRAARLRRPEDDHHQELVTGAWNDRTSCSPRGRPDSRSATPARSSATTS